MNSPSENSSSVVEVRPRRRVAFAALGGLILAVALVAGLASPDPAAGAGRKPPQPSATAPPTSTTTTVPTTVPTTTASTTAVPSTTTPTTAPTPSTTSSTPATTRTATCSELVEFAGESYCSTTVRAITGGQHPEGARVVVRDAWVLESSAALVVIGRDECPAGSYCGATVETVAVMASGVVDVPPVDQLVDAFGTVTPDNQIAATGFGAR